MFFHKLHLKDIESTLEDLKTQIRRLSHNISREQIKEKNGTHRVELSKKQKTPIYLDFRALEKYETKLNEFEQYTDKLNNFLIMGNTEFHKITNQLIDKLE